MTPRRMSKLLAAPVGGSGPCACGGHGRHRAATRWRLRAWRGFAISAGDLIYIIATGGTRGGTFYKEGGTRDSKISLQVLAS